MNTTWHLRAMILTVAAFLLGCGDDSVSTSGNGNNKLVPDNRVNWSAVPAEYHPSIQDISFQYDGIERIYIDAFSSDDDAEVVYSDDLPANSGFLRLYKVWSKSASFGGLTPNANGKVLDLRSYGQYQCSIEVKNGKIVALEGGCYVRLQLVLPKGAEVEVYNVGKLISKRFIPMAVETFLEEFDDATWSTDKFAVIEEYLRSYTATGKRPSLTTQQLGIVVGDFSRSEEKFRALRRLQRIVSDRQSLYQMIEEKFSYFDREEARRICGL